MDLDWVLLFCFGFFSIGGITGTMFEDPEIGLHVFAFLIVIFTILVWRMGKKMREDFEDGKEIN